MIIFYSTETYYLHVHVHFDFYLIELQTRQSPHSPIIIESSWTILLIFYHTQILQFCKEVYLVIQNEDNTYACITVDQA